GARFVPADLTAGDLTALASGQDVVFHAAALSSPWGDPKVFDAINVEATRRLLAAAQAAGCDAFVFVSTPSVYAAPCDRTGLTEDSPVADPPANDYARTKGQAEREVLAANAPGFATVAIRPRALVGPDDTVLLPRILRIARGRRFPLINGGEALIELTDVRDAARALMLADRHRARAAGLVVNISGGQPRTVRETVAEVAAALDLHPRFVSVGYGPLAALARVMELVCARLPGRPEPPFTPYSLQTLAFSQTFDLARARALLGYEPRHTPAEAIARAAAALKGAATT
ncbi:MAG TPA: NAD-dependent epimerase/dehydratase family protein, partial [Caulobacteraceae bacterium]